MIDFGDSPERVVNADEINEFVEAVDSFEPYLITDTSDAAEFAGGENLREYYRSIGWAPVSIYKTAGYRLEDEGVAGIIIKCEVHIEQSTEKAWTVMIREEQEIETEEGTIWLRTYNTHEVEERGEKTKPSYKLSMEKKAPESDEYEEVFPDEKLQRHYELRKQLEHGDIDQDEYVWRRKLINADYTNIDDIVGSLFTKQRFDRVMNVLKKIKPEFLFNPF